MVAHRDGCLGHPMLADPVGQDAEVGSMGPTSQLLHGLAHGVVRMSPYGLVADRQSHGLVPRGPVGRPLERP